MTKKILNLGSRKRTGSQPRPRGIAKCPTGIRGLDDITKGGLPRGRPTLACGRAGCGKTVLAMEFLVRGATEFNEPGVFVSFEETSRELIENVRSLGFELDKLIARKKIVIDHVLVERSEIEETGEYDLEGLFIRLAHATKSIGAKRVVLDTLEALFAGLRNEAVIRSELRRLFRWLKDQGLTAVITAERGEKSLIRHGLEEYVADCVVLLDHRADRQVTTRRMHIIKYRGSEHGTNEYPFLITPHGISVMPVTSLHLDHPVTTQRISTGIKDLDRMFGNAGYFRGTSILASGTPGTGKTSVAVHLVDAACRRGERALIFAYEESVDQLTRNLRSIGLNLAQWMRRGRLRIHASRPTLYGMERHLIHIQQTIEDFSPRVVMMDPISNLSATDNDEELKPALTRIIDFIKGRGITAIFTQLQPRDASDLSLGVSSLMDTWIVLRNEEHHGELRRTLRIVKSRGMAHSKQIGEFEITDRGLRIAPGKICSKNGVINS